MTVENFAARIRAREPMTGYWVVLDNPVGTERIAGQGWDYVCVDAQHGLLDYKGILGSLTAIDARGTAAGMVRVPANDPFWIGQSLDAGARGVIVPMVNTAEQAAAAVSACRYPPHGVRSYGPMRSMLRIGPAPAVADREVACIVMVETREALANVTEICATDGVDAVYIGPSDLTIALGGATSTDPAVSEEFEAALAVVAEAARAAGIGAGIHTPSGEAAARRLAQGFSFATVACDLNHLEQAAAAHLAAARG
ncbi:HpcH/HpaI aldolase [Streptomyces xiamenensis]|uniref:HpcH/HpaI aldolase n=1 Tax=Streptomyces xiamenensis TaxID=408015 RepID=A0A0F7CP25_9ACTN|nr:MULTISPECIES: aldolase/citrate lyase family protein [Streptomyces]AKG43921.1 HpcH/HpaI aldolase [Streptomyces xiamenensis]